MPVVVDVLGASGSVSTTALEQVVEPAGALIADLADNRHAAAHDAVMTTTRPDGPAAGGRPRDETSSAHLVVHGGSTALVGAVGLALLTTAAVVLWHPIDMAAIERADDAGWDTTLLHPHQFLLSAALLCACLCSWVTAIITARAFWSHTRAGR